MRHIIGVIIGIILVLAGIFRWYVVLALFTLRFRPKTDMGVLVIRIVSIVFGLASIIFSLCNLIF